MIKATISEHSGTINSLASDGKIAPVEFTAPDGIRRKANSCWAASDWLKTNGWYDRSGCAPTIWHLGESS
jgi:hypothetical protein